jgi:hypothetical protein
MADREVGEGGPFIAAVFVLVGIGVILMATGVIPAPLKAPPLVVAAAGLAFAGSGAAVFFQRWPRVGRACGATAVSSLGIVAAWCALTEQKAEVVRGAIPFLGPEWTEPVARVLFGIAALVCFLMAARVALQIFRPPDA